MPELGFRDRSSSARSGFRARDASPDSLTFTLESNFSLFSSASASVDRCSFASDAHDRDSLASDVSLHLAGHESSSGPDPDPIPNPDKATVHIKHRRLSRKGEKGKVQKDDNEAERDEPLDSARSSFSVALKECQDRRSRSEALLKKPGRRRPTSLDLNNVTGLSPRLGAMKKSSVTPRKSSAFPSPVTPNYRQASAGMQKGWSSERVPLHTNSNRTHVNAAAMLPYNNGRTLPSKWEDAERWIFSPVSGDGARPSAAQPQRRPKSKSGPLGPPGIAYYSLYSPAVPMFDGMNMGNFMAGSPFSAGVIAADGLRIRSGGCDGSFPAQIEPCMARSVSVHGCSETLNQPSLPNYIDGEVKDAAANVSRVVSRRDMATQMSPVGSANSSPKGRLSFSASNPSALSVVELQNDPSSNLEGRDVQVDERVTVTRWSKKHKVRVSGKSSENVDDWRKKTVSAQASAWDITDTSKSISKVTREEAKITAWENLQKAKAEAAIRKLEMKLEKKRSSSMDKIMNKLKSAQKKAQKMKSSVTATQRHQVDRPSNKIVSFSRTRQMGSLSGCFTCHAF